MFNILSETAQTAFKKFYDSTPDTPEALRLTLVWEQELKKSLNDHGYELSEKAWHEEDGTVHGIIVPDNHQDFGTYDDQKSATPKVFSGQVWLVDNTHDEAMYSDIDVDNLVD